MAADFVRGAPMTATLKSLALTAEERKDFYGSPVASSPNSSDGPKYSYGTRLDLGDAELKKLGVAPMVGVKEVTIIAKATITSYSENTYIDEGKEETRRNLTLQITDMAITPGDAVEDAKPSAVKVLYGD
jgi:hypothetical protein